MQGASPLASPGLNLRFAAKPTEFLYLERCRQPRRGGTGGEELRRLRWSSPPGQVEPMPHGERSPAPVGRHRSRGRTTHPAGELSPCLACATCRSHPWRGRGREVRQRRGLAGGKGGKLPPRSRALQKNFQKPLTEAAQYDIIAKRCQDSGKGHGGVAQLARATGSYPVGHRFKSGLRYHIGQGSAVPYPSGTALVRGFPPGPLVKRPKTPPFHGGNSSSNLLRVTK